MTVNVARQFEMWGQIHLNIPLTMLLILMSVMRELIPFTTLEPAQIRPN